MVSLIARRINFGDNTAVNNVYHLKWTYRLSLHRLLACFVNESIDLVLQMETTTEDAVRPRANSCHADVDLSAVPKVGFPDVYTDCQSAKKSGLGKYVLNV